MTMDGSHIVGAIITIATGVAFLVALGYIIHQQLRKNQTEFINTLGIVTVILFASIGFINMAVYLLEAFKNFIR